jgi:hypothetical protein
MDAAFVFLGLVMAAGSLFIYQEFNYADKKDPQRRAAFVGFLLMAIAGLGAIMVGAFPENKIGILHAIGAGLAIVAGNLGRLPLFPKDYAPSCASSASSPSSQQFVSRPASSLVSERAPSSESPPIRCRFG